MRTTETMSERIETTNPTTTTVDDITRADVAERIMDRVRRALGSSSTGERRSVDLGLGREIRSVLGWIMTELDANPSAGWTLEQAFNPTTDLGKHPDDLLYGIVRWLHVDARRIETDDGAILVEGEIRTRRWDVDLPDLTEGWRWDALRVPDDVRVAVGTPVRLTCDLLRDWDEEGREIPWQSVDQDLARRHLEMFGDPPPPETDPNSDDEPVVLSPDDLDDLVVRAILGARWAGQVGYEAINPYSDVQPELSRLAIEQAHEVRRRLLAAGVRPDDWHHANILRALDRACERQGDEEVRRWRAEHPDRCLTCGGVLRDDAERWAGYCALCVPEVEDYYESRNDSCAHPDGCRECYVPGCPDRVAPFDADVDPENLSEWERRVYERTGWTLQWLPELPPEAMLAGQVLLEDPETGDRIVTVGEPSEVLEDGTEIYWDFGIVRGEQD